MNDITFDGFPSINELVEMARKVKLSKGQTRLVCFGFGVIITALLLLEVLAMTRSIAALTWQPVPATIRSNHLTYQNRARRLDVSFSYEVAGTKYHADRIRFAGYKIGWPWLMANLNPDVHRFAEGNRVTAFYDPNDPQEAVLKRGPTVGALFTLAVYACLSVFLLSSSINESAFSKSIFCTRKR